MLEQPLVQLAQAAHPQAMIGGPPGLVERAPGGGDGAVHVRLGRVGGDADDLLRRRVDVGSVRPSDAAVSKLVAFLASDKSRYMTGQDIRLDAGAMLKGGMSF
jgi:NAD(P)-dependent dehydrogenase (short-subunit alcohol dehydrogenase family)